MQTLPELSDKSTLNMFQKIYCIFTFFCIIKFNIFAEDIKILSFLSEMSDPISSISPMEDSNGDLCALVRIDIPVKGCKFEGFVVDSKFETDCYILNISSQSKKITIKCPGYDTSFIEIGAFPGKKQLSPGGRYHVTVDMTGSNQIDDGGNFVVVNIIPNDLSNGILTIGDKTHPIINGQVIDFLKYGHYNSTVTADGFQSKSESFNISPDKTTIVDIFLNSEMAKLNIECQTPDSAIFINGDKKDKNIWEGSLPEGDYLVEVTKVGYMTYSKKIHLNKNEIKKLTIALQEKW